VARIFVVGVLVSSNTGVREQLVVDGVPVGRELEMAKPSWVQQGSIVIVVATDAPLGPRQLHRLAKRSFLGLARTGAAAHNGSGDFAVAFSTADPAALDEPVRTARELDNEVVSPLFDAVCEATAEAVWNALCAGEDFTGRAGSRAPGLPHDELVEILVRHGRLRTPA
jgi:D-aminopeptidase